jgi:class 3 adenylate cyclase
LLACFGLPPWTYEKDALHAVKASIVFQQSLERLGLNRVPVSIATGELLLSVLGNHQRRELSLLGDVVNLAARLLHIPPAQDGIVCDEATYQAAKQDVNLPSCGEFSVRSTSFIFLHRFEKLTKDCMWTFIKCFAIVKRPVKPR